MVRLLACPECEEAIRTWLPHPRRPKNCLAPTIALHYLQPEVLFLGADAFLERLFQVLEFRWKNRTRTRPPGENWRWGKVLDVAPDNTSPEVRLERWIVDSHGDEWANMIPTGSGVFDDGGRRISIDLASRVQGTLFFSS